MLQGDLRATFGKRLRGSNDEIYGSGSRLLSWHEVLGLMYETSPNYSISKGYKVAYKQLLCN